jgi:cytoskeletal protein CcmA (bactofilin family)
MINNLDFTFIGKNSNLKGDFIFNSNTKIAGTIVGNLFLKNEATLTLEIGSTLNGVIKGHHIEIYGSFNGEIESTGTIIIYPTGNVEGKILAKSIEVLPGANLNIIGHTLSN